MITKKDVIDYLKYLERTRQYFVHDYDIQECDGYIWFKGTIGRASIDCSLYNEDDLFKKLRG